MYAANAVSEYQAFVNDGNDALHRVESAESTILLGILMHALKQTMKQGKT